jgi:hypothetical protein
MQIRSPSGLLALLVLAAPSAFADLASAPPPWPVFKERPLDIAVDPVRPLLMGALRVTLDGSKLADTRLSIGIGASQRQGSGTDALDSLCYTLPDGTAPQRMWLTSSELSRGRIDGVIAAELPAGTAPTAECPDLPARFRPVRFDDGLWLGPLSTELRRAVGIPAKVGVHFASLFQGQMGNLQKVSSTSIEFRGGRAITLHVAHSSAN